MKKTLLFFLVLTVFSSLAFARRLDNPSASRMAVLRSGSTFKVFYKGSNVSNVVVSIYDAHGKRVLSDNLGRTDNFVRPYNFSGLAEGDYRFELSDGSGKQIENVEYRQGKIEKLATLIKVAGEESKYLLMIPSQGEDVLRVRIVNDADEVIYQSEEKVNGDFARVYDLKAASRGFSFEITDSKGVSKTIRY